MIYIDMSKTLYEEIDSFFGSKKGRLFTALNYKGTNFGTALNTKENPDTIKSEPIYQLLLAKNYRETKDAGDNVLSQTFVNFVKDVARNHRKLEGKEIETPVVQNDANIQRIEEAPAEEFNDALVQEGQPGLAQRAYNATTNAISAVGQFVGLTGGNSMFDFLTPDGLEFYLTFINFVDRDLKASTTKYIPNAKINLKKVDHADKRSETIFCSTLPYLPKGTVYNGKQVPVSYLHLEYMDEFHGDNDLAGGNYGDLVNDWPELDLEKFFENVMKVQKEVLSKPSVPTPLDGIYDLAMEKLYSFKNGVLVDKNDKEVEPLAKSLAGDNCHGTYLKNCDLVYECLLQGDPVALQRCLGKLTTESMYDVASSEIKKMNPRVIEKILKTFAVAVNKYGKIEEYLEWRSGFESRLASKMGADKASVTAKAVFGNKKLSAYIKNLMEILRNNPVSLPDSHQLSDLPEKTKNIKSATGLKYYVKPSSANRPQAISSQLSSIVQQLNVLPKNFMAQIGVPMQLANVNFGLGLGSALGIGVMHGAGAVDETVNAMRTLYKEILAELEKNGKTLVQEDKNKIEAALDALEKNNKQLIEALNDLKAFTKLNNAFTAGISSISLGEIKGANKISLDSQVKHLQNCVDTTSGQQRNLMQTLITQVFEPMVKLASGIHTTGIRVV